MDFRDLETVRNCWIVNDGVMGGVSQSRLRHEPEGMVFEGVVSLENNGGFASTRASVRFSQGIQNLELSARGDGKRYKVILRTQIAPQVTYEAGFLADPTWQSYRFTTDQFKASFRGRSIAAPDLFFADVAEFGILIADKQDGAFRLQLEALKLSA